MIGESGAHYKLDATSISREEGIFLQKIIESNPTFKKTLEIGCAWGISSLFICQGIEARENSQHTIIDPFQRIQWDNVGINNLEKAGFSNFQLIEEKSECALPGLLTKNQETFDFVFIDGWHTFDHTLVDLYYSLRLLKIGGVVVIDDVSMSSVRQAVDYVLQFENIELISRVRISRKATNQRILRILLTANPIFRFKPIKRLIKRVLKSRFFYFLYPEEGSSMIAMRKTGNDNRDWNWHSDSF